MPKFGMSNRRRELLLTAKKYREEDGSNPALSDWRAGCCQHAVSEVRVGLRDIGRGSCNMSALHFGSFYMFCAKSPL